MNQEKTEIEKIADQLQAGLLNRTGADNISQLTEHQLDAFRFRRGSGVLA